MEHCGGGDLGKMIKSHLESKELIPEEDIWKLSWQIFEALKECHYNKRGKIIH
jgi:serine/threonine protein kinase